MRGMRDGFGVVSAASAITVVWSAVGPIAYDGAVAVVAAIVGGASLLPAGYFGRKVRHARRELKRMKTARLNGEILE